MHESKTGKSHEMGIERKDERRHEQSSVSDDRRSSKDRRKARFALKFSTAGSLYAVEDWLEDHCTSEWEIVLLDMDDALERKDVQIMFAERSDKDRFIARYSRT